MTKTLIVIDMQNDFVTGPLGTEEARAIVPNVRKKIDEYLDRGDRVIFTQDTHYRNYLDTNEGRHLPVVHCIHGTHGWEIVDGLWDLRSERIPKAHFGANWAYHYFNEVEVVGLCTDICVISNVLAIKSMFPAIEITVDASCCAGTTPENHKAALTVMKACHINVINE